MGVSGYADGPPLGYTGGFGERTCAFCHSDFEPSADGLALSGLPEGYQPGASYRLSLALADELMDVAGFETAIRFADGARAGRQAGALVPADTLATATDSAGVTYVHHRPSGVRTPEGRARWTLLWTAPARGGRVTLQPVANAANGDSSPLGDVIYTTVAESTSR